MDEEGAGGSTDAKAVGAGPPPGLAARLNALRSIHVAERDAAATRDLTGRDRSISRPAFAILVAARLRELRALDELARYLHRGQIAEGLPDRG